MQQGLSSGANKKPAMTFSVREQRLLRGNSVSVREQRLLRGSRFKPAPLSFDFTIERY